jgi:hypothetical protein
MERARSFPSEIYDVASLLHLRVMFPLKAVYGTGRPYMLEDNSLVMT